MKHFVYAAIAGIAMMTAAHAEPLLGTWQTSKDDNGNFGHIQVAPCGDALCGTLIKSFNSAGAEIASDHTGSNIISATTPRGDGEYRGKVFSPDRGKTYNSRLQLTGDTLAVSGCVLGICRDGGTWTKLN
jgi:uncharacterized protein (DUF2147 family)